MNSRSEKLAVKVVAVNRANFEANRLSRELTDSFLPLVGQKILKLDGSLLAKHAGLAPKIPGTPELRIYRSQSNYGLRWVVTTCESLPPHSCIYHETTVDVGELQEQILHKISSVSNHRTDYTAEEIEEARAKYYHAKKVASEFFSELHPFGEYDS